MKCRRCGKQKPEERWSYEQDIPTSQFIVAWFIPDLCDACTRLVCEEDKRRQQNILLNENEEFWK